jgi:predicted anti-sigma-YlaC factor YlaD
MIHCPDKLTIQAVIDGEEKDSQIVDHLKNCHTCRQTFKEIEALTLFADSLKSTAKLPADFYDRLREKVAPRPFPAALVAVVFFTVAFFSAYLANPGFIQWWLSVGVTNQISYLIDLFINLLYMSHFIGPTGVIIGLAALVALEILILNTLKSVEGHANV